MSLSDAARVNIDENWHEETITLEKHSLYRKIDRILADLPVGRVVELGCARGRYLEHLADLGWDVTGVELQPQPQEFIVQHDLSQPLPFDEEFDVVIAAEVIEHIVDTDAFLVTASAILRPGGTLILTTPNLLFGPNRLLMLAGRRPRFAYADYHVRMFVWDDLAQKIAKRFTILHVQGSHVLVGLTRAPTLGRIAAIIGDHLPRLSAHFIVTATKQLRPVTESS